MNKKKQTKTRAEVNREYYLRNKAKRAEKNKAKYDQLHDGRYYTVVGLPVWKDLWEEVKYQFANKNETELNNVKLALAAIFDLMNEKEWYETVKLYSNVIRKRANGISTQLLQELYGVISNDNGFKPTRGRVKYFLSINRNKTAIKNKLGEEIANVYVRSAVPTKLLNKKQIVELEVKMTQNCYKNWGLLTWNEIKEKREKIISQEYDNYKIYMPKSEYVVDETFEQHHIMFTESELEDIENYKKLRVDIDLLNKCVEERLKKALEVKQTVADLEKILSGEESGKRKMVIDFNSMLELSELLKTLTPKDGFKITFSYGRMYFPFFTRINKDFRYLFHKKQIFDVPTCFSTLNMIQYSKSNYRDEVELQKLYDEIMNKDIYVFLTHKIGSEREEVKVLLNHWYFQTRGGRSRDVKLNDKIRKIDEIIQSEFPTFYQFITDSEDVTTKKGKKNVLSIKNQWLENELILNGLFKEIQDQNKINVHDAIYIDENIYSKEYEQEILNKWKVMVHDICFPQI